MPDLPKTIQELKKTLRYRQERGLRTIPKDQSRGEKKSLSAACKNSATGVATKTESLEEIRKDLGDCKRCPLCEGRTNIVFGIGNPRAQLMFIGEAPGRDEDRQGEPFVGRAGQLLNKIIEAMKMKREDVYIGNVAKCRPPENRAPLPNEAETCIPFLHRQIAVIRPQIIVTLGSVATKFILETERSISQLRGGWQDFKGIPVMPTYHPAYLLRNPEKKREVWDDMKKVMAAL